MIITISGFSVSLKFWFPFKANKLEDGCLLETTEQVFHIITLAKINLTLISPLLFRQNRLEIRMLVKDTIMYRKKKQKKTLHVKCSLLLLWGVAQPQWGREEKRTKQMYDGKHTAHHPLFPHRYRHYKLITELFSVKNWCWNPSAKTIQTTTVANWT